MDSYEIRLVQDMLAAGDLTAVEKFIRSLFEQLRSVLPRIRNPRRMNWVRCQVDGLKRIDHLPGPPESPHAHAPGQQEIDPQEVDLCVKRLADSVTLDAFLLRIAGELNLKAAEEDEPARRVWLSQAGEILHQAATASPSTLSYDEIPHLSLRLRHLILTVAAVILLLLLFAGVVAGLAVIRF